MHNIFKFIVSGLVFWSVATVAWSQTEATDSVVVALWQGVEVEMDIVPLLSNFSGDRDSYRYEALARINLKNKYYPVIETGVESSSEQLYNGINYRGEGFFYRLGIDMSMIRPTTKEVVNNKLLLGARLGMTDFRYDLRNIPFVDPYSGNTGRLDRAGLSSSHFWFEIVAGVRIEILKNLMMGWTIRSKNPIGETLPGETGPYYIPGFGKAGGGVWAFNYVIGYQF